MRSRREILLESVFKKDYPQYDVNEVVEFYFDMECLLGLVLNLKPSKTGSRLEVSAKFEGDEKDFKVWKDETYSYLENNLGHKFKVEISYNLPEREPYQYIRMVTLDNCDMPLDVSFECDALK
tara:strand:- start:1797 stop:2165 length:369 start_codon:yes stop_codon:yes gene_type:complete